MSGKTVTFLRDVRVGDLYAEGQAASFDVDTANALIEQGYAVAGRKDAEQVAEIVAETAPEAIEVAVPEPAPASPPAKGKARA